ncbi:MAG: NAD-dependent epimerase/dehydratase family protein [Sulfurimonas sp.]|jgi:UDP-glucose 4-epimerase
MNKILLTGSNGFIGSYFLDNYSTVHDIHKFSFLHDDIAELDLETMDAVVHLSALVHRMGGASAQEYEKINVTQTLELAKKAKASGVKQFVFMSTVKVYGEETEAVYNETSECYPDDEYGKSKLKAERQLQKLESENFRISIIRTPIVYGRGVKANIKNLLNLVKKVSILPFAEIQNRRSMVYVGNLSHLINEVVIQRKSGIFLASDDTPLSTTQLIELIADGLGKKIYLLKIPFFETLLKLLKPSFHKRLYRSLEVDNSATKEKLNLKNPYTTEEAMNLMIKGEK